jgi:cytochrome c55X
VEALFIMMLVIKNMGKVIVLPALILLTSFSQADDQALTDSHFSDEKKAELMHLLKQDCGSCHGMTMKGGLGPALLPETLAKTPNYILVNTIKYGRETLAMPAWNSILNDQEIQWLVDQLKEGIE